MSISIETASAPQANTAGKVDILFDSNSVSNTSPIFNVNKDPYYIEAYNLGNSDIVTVQMVTDSPGGPLSDAYKPFYGPKQLTNINNKLRIDYPGIYSLLYSGPSVASITVKGFAGAMTHESTSELAEALNAIQYAINASATIIGDAPITVTGNGTPLSPYHIGVTLATNLEEENGSPANHIISAGVLKHIVNATTANEDVRLGIDAGTNNPQEICIGFDSGNTSSNVSRTHTINIGHTAGAFAAAASGDGIINLGFGAGAGQSSVGTYDYGVNVGAHAGAEQLVPASYTTFIGAYSGKDCGVGADGAVCIGAYAGNSSVNLTRFVGVGYRANLLSTTGIAMTVVGDSAAYQGVGLANSVIIGVDAARAAGGTGVFIGNSAVQTATLAGGVFLGTSAGQNSKYLSPCVAIGDNAGKGIDYTTEATAPSPIPTPSIFIGANAGVNETHYDVTIIGTNGDGSNLNASANHQIILGNSTQTQLVTAGSVIAGGVIGPSDIRLKKDIKSYSEGLDTVMKLHPVSFMWDEDSLNKTKVPYLKTDLPYQQYGLIAQELLSVLPNAIEKYGDDEHLFVHYDRLVPHLISAVQQLSNELSSLKTYIYSRGQ
jgi:hypothetical protein